MLALLNNFILFISKTDQWKIKIDFPIVSFFCGKLLIILNVNLNKMYIYIYDIGEIKLNARDDNNSYSLMVFGHSDRILVLYDLKLPS